MCHGPSQSESNFINTVIKQEGNYSKYWKNVRVIHELRGDRVLFDTQGINDAKEIYSEIVCTVPPASQLSRPARAPQRRDRGGLASLGSPGKAGGRARRPACGHGSRRRFRVGPSGAEGAARPRAAEGAPGRSPCARTAAPRRRACTPCVPTRAWQWRECDALREKPGRLCPHEGGLLGVADQGSPATRRLSLSEPRPSSLAWHCEAGPQFVTLAVGPRQQRSSRTIAELCETVRTNDRDFCLNV